MAVGHTLLSLCVLLLSFGYSCNHVSVSFSMKIFHLDPEILMNTSQIIRYHGYPCEDHTVTTDDGFVLGVQRIPYKTPGKVDPSRPVVLLQHGLLSCSACWVENLVNESLGFLMADAGFDVWLGNSRGNFYSSRHVKYKPDQEEFWAWSWDQMAKYDLPATINYILQVTSAKQLYYVGHSQGTMIGFAQFGMDKTLGSKVRTFFALGPAAYLSHVVSPIKYLAPFTKDIEFLFNIFGVRDFLPENAITRWLAREICGHEIPDILCENILFVLGGYDFKQMNQSRIPVYVGHNPSGTSVQNMIHFAESIETGKFQMFDYGSPEKNMKHYNKTSPPQYNASNMDTPVVLYSGANDWLADPADVRFLQAGLKNLIKSVVIPEWEHLDFIWGLDAPRVCYDDIIGRIKIQNNMV